MSSVCTQGRLRRPLRDFIRSMARSTVDLVRLWRERGGVRRLLAAMNGRELRDIGVCWTDITDEIGKPFWCPLSEVSAPAEHPPFTNFGKSGAPAEIVIPGQPAGLNYGAQLRT